MSEDYVRCPSISSLQFLNSSEYQEIGILFPEFLSPEFPAGSVLEAKNYACQSPLKDE